MAGCERDPRWRTTMDRAKVVTKVDIAKGSAPLPASQSLNWGKEESNRDIFGKVRGACSTPGCGCAGFTKLLSDYVAEPGDGRGAPVNDISCINCSTCGCTPQAHPPLEADDAREQGNDAFAFGEYEKAILPYTKAISLAEPGDARPWSNRAATYAAMGKWSEALHDACRACEIEPTWAKARARKALAETHMGKLDAAAASYRAALKLEPDNAEYAGLLSEAEARRKAATKRRAGGAAGGGGGGGDKERAAALVARSDFAGAVRIYLSLVEKRPDDGLIRSNLSACYARMSRFDEALQAAREAVRVAPRWAKAHTRVGAALFYLKRYDEAVAEYVAALALKPDYEAARTGCAEARAAAAEAKLEARVRDAQSAAAARAGGGWSHAGVTGAEGNGSKQGSGGASGDVGAHRRASEEGETRGGGGGKGGGGAPRGRAARTRRKPTNKSAVASRAAQRAQTEGCGWLYETLGSSAPQATAEHATAAEEGSAYANIMNLVPGDDMNDDEAASLPFAHALLRGAGVGAPAGGGAQEEWAAWREREYKRERGGDGDGSDDFDADGSPAPSVRSKDDDDVFEDAQSASAPAPGGALPRLVAPTAGAGVGVSSAVPATPVTPRGWYASAGEGSDVAVQVDAQALSPSNIARLSADLGRLADAVRASPAREGAAAQRAQAMEARAREAREAARAVEADAREALAALASARAEVGAEKAKAEVLREEYADLERTHTRRVEELTSAHETRLADLRASQEREHGAEERATGERLAALLREQEELAANLHRLRGEKGTLIGEIEDCRKRSSEAAAATAALRGSVARMQAKVKAEEARALRAEREAERACEHTAECAAAERAAEELLKSAAARLDALCERSAASEESLRSAAQLCEASFGERARGALASARRAADGIVQAEAAIAHLVTQCVASVTMGSAAHLSRALNRQQEQQLVCPLSICSVGELCEHAQAADAGDSGGAYGAEAAAAGAPAGAAAAEAAAQAAAAAAAAGTGVEVESGAGAHTANAADAVGISAAKVSISNVRGMFADVNIVDAVPRGEVGDARTNRRMDGEDTGSCGGGGGGDGDVDSTESVSVSEDMLRFFAAHIEEHGDDDDDDDDDSVGSEAVEPTDEELVAELEFERRARADADAARAAASSAAASARRAPRRPPSTRTAASAGGGCALDISSVIQLANRRSSRRRDHGGMLRVRCTRAACPVGCEQFEPNRSGRGPPDCCVSCGCPDAQHETEAQADAREQQEADEELKRTDVRSWRMRNASRLVGEAEANGEFVQETAIDPIRGCELHDCGGCGGCPGFVIRYCTSLAHDSKVMMFCSACGCGCDEHLVSNEWKAQEEDRKAQEERFYHHREETQRRVDAQNRAKHAQDTKRSRHLRTLGLDARATAKEASKAYRKLALRFHPDKQRAGASNAARARAAQRFVAVTDAFKKVCAMLAPST